MLDALEETTATAVTLDRILTRLPTSRVERLRDAFLSAEPAASIDRAQIEARILKETDGQPMVTRRAKVFAAMVREAPINIYPDELLMGYPGIRRRCSHISPTPGLEKSVETPRPSHWGTSDSIGFDRPDLTAFSDEERRALREEILPYWHGRQDWEKAMGTRHYGHNIIGYDKALAKGFLGIKKEAEERIARLDITEPEDLRKIPFLEGVVMAMDAAADIGRRFADLAKELAENEEELILGPWLRTFRF